MSNTIYSQSDLTAIRAQKSKRWLALGIPCAVLAAALVYSLVIRLEWLTSAATIVIGAILIGGYDFFVKPLVCYEKHLKNCLQGRTRACDLPFISLSENVDVVDGVRCRQLLCEDFDAKGRPYERLFYFDAEKQLPDIQPGQTVRIIHHDLMVADISLA